MVNETFKDLLFYPESDCLSEFPSPEELKYRVIISTKPPKEYLEQAKTVKETENRSPKNRRDSDNSSRRTKPSSEPADHEQEESQSVHNILFFYYIILISVVTLNFLNSYMINFLL